MVKKEICRVKAFEPCEGKANKAETVDDRRYERSASEGNEQILVRRRSVATVLQKPRRTDLTGGKETCSAKHRAGNEPDMCGAVDSRRYRLIQAFTLAEVLITLAIIGVVAAGSIPSVISNSQQQEFKTGLRKAVSVLNSAITMNMALDGETPYDNANLFGYMMKHMAVMQSVSKMQDRFYIIAPNGYAWANSAFYTTDGMRFEFRAGAHQQNFPLYENPSFLLCTKSTVSDVYGLGSDFESCGGCGSLGLNNNPDQTTKPPCLIMVDVNGDRKPNPQNASCKSSACANQNVYKFSDPEGKILTDMFTIMITDKEAIPYGVAAQKAMYQSQK